MLRSSYSLSDEEFKTAQEILNYYANGAFPMDNGDGLNWYLPVKRAVIYFDKFNYPRSLRKFLEKSNFEYRLDTCTEEVINKCANREETWISEEVKDIYRKLFPFNVVHSVEVFENNQLVGGLYGISILGMFIGESMFSKVSQASKAALVYLVNHLKAKEYIFLDVQLMNSHLKMFNAIEIDENEYDRLVNLAFEKNISFI